MNFWEFFEVKKKIDWVALLKTKKIGVTMGWPLGFTVQRYAIFASSSR